MVQITEVFSVPWRVKPHFELHALAHLRAVIFFGMP